MTDLSDKLAEELEELRGLRDDLRLQVHLGKMEVQERWEKAEKDWEHLEGRLKLVGAESRETLEEVGEAAKLVLEEIRQGYRHIKELL